MSAAEDVEKPVILLVDDQEAKLLSYEIILQPLGYTLIRASGASEALATLLKTDVAVVLLDVAMPEMDGFELATMIRSHPRFATTAIIFVSAIHLSPEDAIRGYALGGVDYVPVPVMADVLRSKVKVFADLFVKSRALERLNADLELRVAQRTEDLETAIARQTMLAREVNHRAKNTLAIVRSLVRLTRAASVPDYVQALEGRIDALALCHDLLSDKRWQGAEVRRILQEELSPYLDKRDKRVKIEGNGGLLQPAAAQGLALSIHELATNAAKYGALSEERGQLSIGIAIKDRQLEILWSESGGPPVAPPTKSGFGSTLVTASVAQLDGTAEFNWEPHGLKCRISFPLTAAFEDSSYAELASEPAQTDRVPAAMVVEPDVSSARTIVSVLGELGFSTRGPVSKSESAVLLAKTATLQLAVVDDMVGEPALQVIANILRERHVPWLLLSSQENLKFAEKRKAAGTLAKPFAAQHLRSALARLVTSSADGRPRLGPATSISLR